ncbi:hypothetical protein [Massilia sp.]|uniref:hypothetical protein n=1 Tax=Massilia sp. TaxID=1882437 RepID=UPI0028A8ABA3|nr:hypothetical protein [Massilia sp.]
MKIDASRAQTVLLLLAIGLLVVSLCLPATEDSRGRQIPGWAAMMLALVYGAGMLVNMFSKPENFHAVLLLPFLAAVLNLNFIVTAICLNGRKCEEILPRWLPGAALCGAILAIVSPFALRGSDTLAAGFYTWLLAHGCLIAAVVSARHVHHKTHR